MSLKSTVKRIVNLILFRKEYFTFFRKSFLHYGSETEIKHPSYIPYKKNISIGNNTTILPNSRIQVCNYLTGLNSTIKIGSKCYFAYNLTILAGADIEIEDEVLIASNVFISSENHSMNPESPIPYMDQDLICKPVKIGSGTWIGEKASILPGVTIGKKCIIGTNAVVTKDIPDYSIAAGIPARVIKKYNFDSHKWEKC